jgi:hypothetical protein
MFRFGLLAGSLAVLSIVGAPVSSLAAQTANPIAVRAPRIEARAAANPPQLSKQNQSERGFPKGTVGALIGGIVGGTTGYLMVTNLCDTPAGCSRTNAVIVGAAIGIAVGIGVEWLVRGA